ATHVENVAEVPHEAVRFASEVASPPPQQPLRVVVVGSEPAVAMRLATAPRDLDVDIINATDPNCPIFRDNSNQGCDFRPSPAQMVQFLNGADVAVLALGPTDRAVVKGITMKRWWSVAAGARLRLATLVSLGVPIVVADTEPGGGSDAPGNLVSEVVLHSPRA